MNRHHPFCADELRERMYVACEHSSSMNGWYLCLMLTMFGIHVLSFYYIFRSCALHVVLDLRHLLIHTHIYIYVYICSLTYVCIVVFMFSCNARWVSVYDGTNTSGSYVHFLLCVFFMVATIILDCCRGHFRNRHFTFPSIFTVVSTSIIYDLCRLVSAPPRPPSKYTTKRVRVTWFIELYIHGQLLFYVTDKDE